MSFKNIMQKKSDNRKYGARQRKFLKQKRNNLYTYSVSELSIRLRKNMLKLKPVQGGPFKRVH